MKLGEILVKQGLLSRADLASALAHQEAHGARLGAFLVENGILSCDQVTLALAEQLGVPPALEADFARADASLRRRMVVHQAIELQAIPLFFINPRRVAVAMANPANPRAIDRLAFILGATVEPLVAADVALTRQFEVLYRVKRKRSPALRPAPGQPAACQPPPAGSPPSESSEIRPALRSYVRRAKPRLAPLKPGARVPEPCAPVAVMEDALCFTPTPLSSLPRTRVRPPLLPARVASHHPLTPIVAPINQAGAELAVEQIRFATDRQDLSDNLFTLMRVYFNVGAMFEVTGAMAQGLFGFCDGRVRPEVETLRFSLSLPSCFRIARSRRSTFRGPPPPDGGAVQQSLWAALRSQPPADVLVSPIIVDKVVTLLLYAQGEAGGRINDLVAGKMRHVSEALGSSLLRLAG